MSGSQAAVYCLPAPEKLPNGGKLDQTEADKGPGCPGEYTWMGMQLKV